MKTIIERLGITPLKSYFISGEEYIYEADKIRKLESDRNEMLEALILMMNESEEILKSGRRKGKLNPTLINLIQKATNKSWEEIRNLIDKKEDI